MGVFLVTNHYGRLFLTCLLLMQTIIILCDVLNDDLIIP